MREHEWQQACFPAGRASGHDADCPGRPLAQPGIGRGGERPGLGRLWLLLIPTACCGGPLLAAGLAAAGALAWGGLGLALAALLAGALLVIRLHRQARAGSGASTSPEKPQPAVPEVPPR